METLSETTHHNYTVKPVFDYSNGKHDFQVYKEGADHGSIYPYQTLLEVKEDIDEKTANENP